MLGHGVDSRDDDKSQWRIFSARVGMSTSTLSDRKLAGR